MGSLASVLEQLSAVGLVFLLELAACARTPDPCTTPGTCPQGQECLANRCVPFALEPVPSAAVRTVLRPAAIAVVTSRTKGPAIASPVTVTFGSAVEGEAALYLRFPWPPRAADDSRPPNPMPPEATPALALLVLEADPESFGDSQDVLVHVWNIAEPWSTDALTWVNQPQATLPESRGLGRNSPPSPLRIDVTALIQHWSKFPREALGLVLRSKGGSGHGATYLTGALAGSPPRLEIYSTTGEKSQ